METLFEITKRPTSYEGRRWDCEFCGAGEKKDTYLMLLQSENSGSQVAFCEVHLKQLGALIGKALKGKS